MRQHQKRNVAPALPNDLHYVLTDDCHSWVVKVQARTSDGTAECDVAKQRMADAARFGRRAMEEAHEAFGHQRLRKDTQRDPRRFKASP